MISLGGVKLTAVSRELCSRIEAEVSPRDILEHARLLRRDFSWPLPPQFPERPSWVGSLWWPWGASRWAQGHFLATESQCERLRKLSYSGDGGSYRALEFILSDGRGGREIATDLWLLPPRPLSQIDGANGLYLLTLVDDRFWWWEKSAAVSVTGGTTTWAQLFSSIGTALGVTVTADSIASAYLSPSWELAASYEYLPPLLDAVCDSTGRRLVRSLSGVVTAQTPQAAKASEDRYYSAWKRRKGGLFYFGTSGPNDHPANVPARVDVIFPRADSGIPAGTDFVESVTLASLAIREYRGSAGHAGVKVIHDSCAANYTGGGTPANAAELTALAQQIASDWYRWRLASLDVLYNGVAPWPVTGMSDVEWSLGEERAATRVQKSHGPLEALYHHGASGTLKECCGTFLTGTVNYVNNPTTFTSTVTIDVDETTEKSLVITPPDNSTVSVIDIDQPASSTGNIIDVSVGGTPAYAINKDGYLIIYLTAAPADGDLTNSSFAFFIDPVTGLPSFKSKDSGGTVREGTLLTDDGTAETWVRYALTYDDFNDGGAVATVSVTVRTLAAKEMLHAVIVKHGVLWAGTSMTDIDALVTMDGNNTNATVDLDTAPAASVFGYDESDSPYVGVFESLSTGSGFTDTRDVAVSVTAVGGTLDNLTAGELEVWLKVSTLP